MVKDPIIEEIHEIRRQLADEHGNSMQRLGAYFMERQKQHADKLTAFPPRRPAGWVPPQNSASVQRP
jgi:hypothetical protein